MKVLSKRKGKPILSTLTIILLWTGLSYASEWMAPREIFKDPSTARLQRGQKELTELEKKEVDIYGFTGLELTTYLYCNQEPGHYDKDNLTRYYNITPKGKILRVEYLDRMKYYYKDKPALSQFVGIKPGDVYRK